MYQHVWESSVKEEKLSLWRCRRLQTARTPPLSSLLQPPRAEQVVQRQTFPCLGWQPSTSPWKRDFSQASQPFSEKKKNSTLYNRAQEKKKLVTFLYIKIPPISINGMCERQCDVYLKYIKRLTGTQETLKQDPCYR